jgi:hypothetical protein
MSEWHPIESVQKNGLEVDLWCLNISDGSSTRFPAMFMNDDGKWEDWHSYILEPKWRPVYWMPIPAPPAK